MSSLPESTPEDGPETNRIAAVEPLEEKTPSEPEKPEPKRTAPARSAKPRAPRTPAAKAGTAAAKPRAPRTSKRASTRASSPATAPEPQPEPEPKPTALGIRQLYKRFGGTVALDGVTIDVPEGSFFGIVGPNGAGKTTMLSIVSGLLRPDSGQVVVHDVDVWKQPDHAKRLIGVLPDRLRLFDRLTGAQLLYYSGTLRGLDARTVKSRVNDLVEAFGLEGAVGRLVADYSAGMTKKIALAAALIHSPRVLVLDEPFESVDPVSAANITEILQKYVAAGGTVVLSSHSMDLIQRICDRVAIIVAGVVLDSGTADEVRGERTLEERFVELAGGRKAAEGLEWLHSFSE
jgi:ABC-2 type transport system ATP-binding protein